MCVPAAPGARSLSGWPPGRGGRWGYAAPGGRAALCRGIQRSQARAKRGSLKITATRLEPAGDEVTAAQAGPGRGMSTAPVPSKAGPAKCMQARAY
ncbi:unnamed protein product, partial [Amoebophrya sp. A120]|eukprot:GSA120T00016050001.1